MSNFKVGTHDKGFWDSGNNVNADKNPIASGLTTDQAIEKAKQHPGSELIVVKPDGKASVHSLAVEDGFFSKEGKKVLISELDRDPAKKVDSAKTPLAIDNNIAYAFSGQAAFVVDEKNNSTYLGDVVDQTNAAVKLKDSDKFIANPTPEKVNAAYAIARDGGDERHVDKAMAKQALDQLQQNYRNSDGPAHDIGLIKPGDVKTKVEGLIGELRTLAGQEKERVTDLRGQLQRRTDTYQTDLQEPTKKLDAANNAWDQANARETQNVNKTAYNLREARMPNIHQLERSLDEAKGNSARAQQDMNGAIQNRVQAEGRVNDLERLPAEADNHLQEARRLESENRGLHGQIQLYVTSTLGSVQSELRDVNRNIQSVDSRLANERAKPTQPAGNGDPTTNPFNNTSGGSKPSGNNPTTNPFNNTTGGSKPSHETNPFAGGNNGGGSVSAPPGGWRDESRINDLERQGRSLRSDREDLRARESSLQNINARLLYTKDVDQITILFSDLSSVDRMALNAYKDRKDSNERQISEQHRAANQANNTYQNEIGGARRNLANATSEEESARSNFAQAENRVGNLSGQVQDLLNNPRPDNHPEVKPMAVAYQKAVEHKEATVGGNAPLTTTRDKAQTIVNDINSSYQRDKGELEGKIANVQQTLLNDAQSKIAQTRNQVK